MAAAGWDDDGVRTQRWYPIKNGIFQTYQTTRDQAHLIGDAAIYPRAHVLVRLAARQVHKLVKFRTTAPWL